MMTKKEQIECIVKNALKHQEEITPDFIEEYNRLSTLHYYCRDSKQKKIIEKQLDELE